MGCSLLIFCIIGIKLIEFLQTFQFISLFLEIIVLRHKRIDLFLQFLIFRAELLHRLKVFRHISQPAANIIDALLERDHSHIGKRLERS